MKKQSCRNCHNIDLNKKEETEGKVLWSLNDKKNIGKVSAACLVSNPKFKINVVE